MPPRRYIPSMFSGVYFDQHIIMTNHLLMVVVITRTGGHGNPPLYNFPELKNKLFEDNYIKR